jgi:hypothetical protein
MAIDPRNKEKWNHDDGTQRARFPVSLEKKDHGAEEHIRDDMGSHRNDPGGRGEKKHPESPERWGRLPI